MPAIERAPEPRPSPSSTVSAWSSRVCASSTGAPRAGLVERAVAGGAGSGLGPARRCRRQRKAPVRQRIPVPAPVLARSRRPPPNPAAARGRRSARWSACTVAATAVSASESAPPDSATHHRSVCGVVADEARDRRAQLGYSTLSIHRCGSSISVGSGRRLGVGPDGVEALPSRPWPRRRRRTPCPGCTGSSWRRCPAARASAAAAEAVCAAGARRTGAGWWPPTAPRRARRRPSRGRRGPPAGCPAPAAGPAPRAAARTARRAATRRCRPNSVAAQRHPTVPAVADVFGRAGPTICADVSAPSSRSAPRARSTCGRPATGWPGTAPGGSPRAGTPTCRKSAGRHPQLPLDGDHVGVHQQQLTAAVISRVASLLPVPSQRSPCAERVVLAEDARRRRTPAPPRSARR